MPKDGWCTTGESITGLKILAAPARRPPRMNFPICNDPPGPDAAREDSSRHDSFDAKTKTCLRGCWCARGTCRDGGNACGAVSCATPVRGPANSRSCRQRNGAKNYNARTCHARSYDEGGDLQSRSRPDRVSYLRELSPSRGSRAIFAALL